MDLCVDKYEERHVPLRQKPQFLQNHPRKTETNMTRDDYKFYVHYSYVLEKMNYTLLTRIDKLTLMLIVLGFQFSPRTVIYFRFCLLPYFRFFSWSISLAKRLECLKSKRGITKDC